MRELSAKIIYSILRTHRMGHSNDPDSPKCNRPYGFGLTKLEKPSLEWLQTPKGGEKIFTHPLKIGSFCLLSPKTA
jgi:hypothetical protein